MVTKIKGTVQLTPVNSPAEPTKPQLFGADVPILDYRHRFRSKIESQCVSEGIYTNAKLEQFPGFERLTVADRRVFKRPEYKTEQTGKTKQPKPQNPDKESEARSISRARKMVFNIAMLNAFDYLATWTLDPKKIDRENPAEVSKKLQDFLRNGVQRHSLSYLAVPEYHKDGKGIHVHALISGRYRLIDSGRRSNGKPVYNMPDWKFGFSTCIPLSGKRVAVAKYVTKYISKDFHKIFGNFYYAGGNVVREPLTEYLDADYYSIDGKPYFVPALGISFKYAELEGGEAA